MSIFSKTVRSQYKCHDGGGNGSISQIPAKKGEGQRMPKRHFGLMLVMVALLAVLSPADAALDPDSGVLAEELVNVTIENLSDLTTAPQRASNTVHEDARAIAPANPADWIPITGPVPGVL